MILILKTLDRERQIREFSCWLTNLELAFDVVSSISNQPDRILEAYIIDRGRQTYLPTEAFDGQLFSKPIRNLETEWQQILTESIS